LLLGDEREINHLGASQQRGQKLCVLGMPLTLVTHSLRLLSKNLYIIQDKAEVLELSMSGHRIRSSRTHYLLRKALAI